MGIIEKEEKLCLHCNNPIYSRRLGAIYCSLKCGYTFRNNKAQTENKNQNQIIKIIRNNDFILHSKFSNSVFKISLNDLKELGYDLEYHTKGIIKNNQLVGAELFKYKIKKIEYNNFKIEQI